MRRLSSHAMFHVVSPSSQSAGERCSMLQDIGIQTVSGGTSSSLHSMPRVCSRSATSSIEPAYHDHEQTTASFRAPLCAQAQTKSAPKRFARLLSGVLRLTQTYKIASRLSERYPYRSPLICAAARWHDLRRSRLQGLQLALDSRIAARALPMS
jgi:hypothetical protein